MRILNKKDVGIPGDPRLRCFPAAAGCALQRSAGPFANRLRPVAGVGMSPMYSNILFINMIPALFNQIQEFVAGALVTKKDTAEG